MEGMGSFLKMRIRDEDSGKYGKDYIEAERYLERKLS